MLALPWRPWSTRERIEAIDPADFNPPPITVLIPARNEQATIRQTIESVAGQAGIAEVIVVDDQSGDQTARVAAAAPGVRLIEGRPAPPGWSGKLWAQQQGLEHVDTPLVLLLDADIRLATGMVAALARKLEAGCLDQVSVMARLPAASWPERLMLPAFVFFFKQLYPFAWVNRTDRPFAAAAGGCVLVRRRKLVDAGAFEAWKGALIDDCELASRIRGAGGSIWLGLSRGVESMRRHPDLASVLETVRRTAYTQLRYSPLLLVAVVVVMLLAFAVPPAATLGGVLAGNAALTATGVAGWLLMALAYAPQVRFAGLGMHWALSLPASALLFLLATVDSAVRHHFGRGAGWKGRRYGPDA